MKPVPALRSPNVGHWPLALPSYSCVLQPAGFWSSTFGTGSTAGSYLDTTYHFLTLKLSDYKTVAASPARDGDYYELSGTSMAAPMVSATAALLFQKDPTLNPATVKARLMKSADKDDRMVFETGAGYLDVDAALQAKGYVKDAPSPLAMLASDGNVYFQDTGLIWGDRDSPFAWYPSLRRFQQVHPGDWATVVTDVTAAVTAMSPLHLAVAIR